MFAVRWNPITTGEAAYDQVGVLYPIAPMDEVGLQLELPGLSREHLGRRPVLVWQAPSVLKLHNPRA
uniref:hypothetical protein n=1 Tax=Methylobacterium nigriterrae TaxID=3127512 RepID=UPI0030136176